MGRISRVAVAIMRLAMFEVMYMPDIPDGAAINEAVELAKKYEEAETVSFINDTRNSCRPGRDGSYHTDRSRSRVDYVGELCARDLVLIRERTHNATDSKAVEIVVNEDKATETECGKHSTASCLDLLAGPLTVSRRAARAVHKNDHSAEHDKEDEDTYVPRIGKLCDKAVVCEHRHVSCLNIEVCVKKCARKDTDKER